LPLAVGLDVVRSLAGSSWRAQECLDPFIATANVGAEPEWAGFFEAVNRAVSLSGPLIVAVDDVQWSDPQSTALLHYLVRGADAPQFVSDRLRGVSADAWAVLATSVLLARPVHVREIAEIQGWHQDRVRSVLDELSATGLVVEDGPSLRAAHDLVRAAVSSQIP